MSKGIKKRDLTKVTHTVRMANGQVAQLVGREAIRAAHPMESKHDTVRDKSYYHQVTYPAAGTSEIPLFREVAGSGNVTLETTNMEDTGKFTEGKDFFLEGLDILPLPTAAAEADKLADLVKLLNKGRLVIANADDKEIFSDGPLREFVSDLSLIGINTTAGGRAESVKFTLANPITIPGGKRFNAYLRFPGTKPVLSADCGLLVKLLGQEMSAAVQV